MIKILTELTFNQKALTSFRFPITMEVRLSMWFTDPRLSLPSELNVKEPIEIDEPIVLEITLPEWGALPGHLSIGDIFYLKGIDGTIATGNILEVIQQ